MMSNYIKLIRRTHFYTILLLLCLCCQNKLDKSSIAIPTKTNIIPAKSISGRGEQIDLDTILKIIETPLKRTPEKKNAHPNVRIVGTPVVVPLSNSLTIITPGKDSIPLPKSVKAKGKIIPAQFPQPIPAPAFQMRDMAIADIQYFNFDLGAGSNAISCMVEDRRGYIWFGTAEGAICYDGKNILHFTEREGLTNKLIKAIIEDKQGNIWFGTISSGAICFDGTNFIHYTKEAGLSSNSMHTLLEDSRGRVWVGTINGGVSCITGNEITHYTKQEGLNDKSILSIAEDKKGNIWFSNKHKGKRSLGGVIRYDGYTFSNYSLKEGLSYNNVWSIMEDSSGNIWFATAKGATRYNPNGFVHFNEQNGLVHEQRVGSIYEDSAHNLWLGTWVGGLIKYDRDSFTYFTQKEGLVYDIVNNIIEDDGKNLWFDFGALGVSQFDGVNFLHYTDKQNTKFLSVPLLIDSHNDLWFRSRNGLIRKSSKSVLRYSELEKLKTSQVNRMAENHLGDFWLGTDGDGIIKYDGDTFVQFTKQEGLSHDEISSIVADKYGNMWIGTYGGGVNYFDGYEFNVLSENEGLKSNTIYSLLIDKEDNIWIGTFDGISVIVPSADLLQTHEDSISSSKHISDFKVINFDQRDGLVGKQFSSIIRDTDNKIWAGGDAGMSMLDLNDFKIPDLPPHIYLGHIAINQQFIDYRSLKDTSHQSSLSFGEKLSQSIDSIVPFFNYPQVLNLPHDLNHLTFHFSAIDWCAPHKLQYSYMLEGLDKEWSIPQSEPKVDYRNLTSGSYIFKAKAIGIAQIWSDPFTYNFTIYPPWWQSWWAYICYLLIGIASILSIGRYELNRRLAKNEMLRLKELDQVKSRLYTNITHELRTPLTIIKGMARQIKSDPKNWFNEGLQLIERNGDHLLGLITQLLDLSKLESKSMPLNIVNADLIPFLHYITESFHSYADSRDIRLHFSSDFEQLEMDYDPEKIQHVLSNLLSNAIKFTSSGGDIYVDIRTAGESQQNIIIHVRDNGMGIAKLDLPHIFDRFYQVDASNTRRREGTGIGLALVKELVDLMNGTIQVVSEPGVGTKFSITLPITQNAPKQSAASMEDATAKLSQTLVIESSDYEINTVVDKKDTPVVLLIEDNKDVITYLSSFLSLEYTIETASNGQEGIEKALDLIPDLIVSDVMMPEKDGFEVCTTLKTEEHTSHIPIILLTAKSDQKSKIEGLTYGADAYLIKPFHQEELLIRIEQLIASRKQLQLRYEKSETLFKLAQKKKLSREDLFLQKLLQIVEEHYTNENFGLPELCKQSGMSRSQLFRKLKAVTGKSTTHFIRSFRLAKAKALLESSDKTISEIAFEVGFSSANYFTRSFTEAYGVSPKSYRQS